MLKYLSLFSGIGAFESALTNLGVNYEIVNYCEIDKYASKSYSAIHGVPETKNLWDITKVNVFNLPKPGEIDLVTYGFPCQDISLAGKQKGLFNDDGSLTRSGLFFEALKVIEYCKPKVAIAENVKNLTGKKFATQFKTVLKSLEEAGYNNYWKVLNAKDYGIPQNRERVFIVSIRKDVDRELFEFPKPYSLEKRLKDFLEPHVDEKYYLSDKMYTYFTENSKRQEENGNGFRFSPTDGDTIAKTISTRAGSRMDDNFITVPNTTKRGYIEAYEGDSVDLAYPDSTTRRGRVKEGVSGTLTTSDNMGVVQKVGNIYPSRGQNGNVYSVEGISPTISSGVTGTKGNGGIGSNNAPKIVDTLCIRKLTPRECYRLMGFSDAEFDRAEKVNSNTQLYKQAGNSIVVDVLEEIFCMMLDEKGDFYL